MRGPISGGTIRRARRSDLISLERTGAVKAKEIHTDIIERGERVEGRKTASSCAKSSRFTLGKRACRRATRVGNCIVSNTGFNPSASSVRASERTHRLSGVVVVFVVSSSRASRASWSTSLKIARARASLTDGPTDALRSSLTRRRLFSNTQQWTNAER